MSHLATASPPPLFCPQFAIANPVCAGGYVYAGGWKAASPHSASPHASQTYGGCMEGRFLTSPIPTLPNTHIPQYPHFPL